ncbi:MAG TPA: hypothetical protein VK486_07995, partial [Thermoleophilaceae bacterium]|nr:hypothetical protein [Thermoleophilaceae bacterium]
MEPSRPAWRLVQIGELVRRAEQLHLGTMRLLPPEARSDIPEGAAATMTAAELEQLAATAAEGAEVADQVRDLAQGLPDEDTVIHHEDVRDAAAADLGAGMLDPERVLIAARVLDVATGWPALADGLRTVD